MMVSSTKSDNYISYLLAEIVLVSSITFIGAAFIIFYAVGKSDVRTGGDNLSTFTDSPAFYACICLIPVLITVSTLIHFRNRNYIVAYSFDHDLQVLRLEHRKLSKPVSEFRIPFSELEVRKFQERKILVNQTYSGATIVNEGVKYDFVTNNFIWEKHPRMRLNFLRELRELNHQV